MITQEKEANAIGGKTARACDSCLIKRARWFCTADDAFLCQSCDSSVHSANQLASRHQRIRLQTSSGNYCPVSPSWDQGVTRRPRTQRQGSKQDMTRIEDPFRLVPEIGKEEVQENEEEMVFRVPVFDCFAKVKVEDEDEEEGDDDDVYDDEERGIEKQKEKSLIEKSEIDGLCEVKKDERKMLLRLNYEAVITAWDDKGSPWSGGCRPECHPDDWWPDFLGMCIEQNEGPDGSQKRVRVNNDRAREERVSRYREKRRTRLFTNKIRYEVRKLHAEKRPRMKGRFVKRTSVRTGQACPY